MAPKKPVKPFPPKGGKDVPPKKSTKKPLPGKGKK